MLCLLWCILQDQDARWLRQETKQTSFLSAVCASEPVQRMLQALPIHTLYRNKALKQSHTYRSCSLVARRLCDRPGAVLCATLCIFQRTSSEQCNTRGQVMKTMRCPGASCLTSWKLRDPSQRPDGATPQSCLGTRYICMAGSRPKPAMTCCASS